MATILADLIDAWIKEQNLPLTYRARSHWTVVDKDQVRWVMKIGESSSGESIYLMSYLSFRFQRGHRSISYWKHTNLSSNFFSVPYWKQTDLNPSNPNFFPRLRRMLAARGIVAPRKSNKNHPLKDT